MIYRYCRYLIHVINSLFHIGSTSNNLLLTHTPPHVTTPWFVTTPLSVLLCHPVALSFFLFVYFPCGVERAFVWMNIYHQTTPPYPLQCVPSLFMDSFLQIIDNYLQFIHGRHGYVQWADVTGVFEWSDIDYLKGYFFHYHIGVKASSTWFDSRQHQILKWF